MKRKQRYVKPKINRAVPFCLAESMLLVASGTVITAGIGSENYEVGTGDDSVVTIDYFE